MARISTTAAFARAYAGWLTRPRPAARAARATTAAAHDAAAAELARAVAAGPPPFRLVKRGVGHEARAPRSRPGTALDLRTLDGVFDLDRDRAAITVEPQVTIRELVRWAAPHGLAPAVLPEFPEISVGGAVQGLAAESGCHRHGLFHDSAEWYEVILADGRRLRVSAGDHPDLWRALPGSYGTLAILTAVRLRLVPRRPWVRLTHRRTTVGAIAAHALPWNHDLVDAICVRGDEAVVTTGDLVDQSEPGLPVWRSRPAGAYYCDHVLATGDATGPELMAFEDYAFRYDRGAFWIGPEKLGRSAPARVLFGGFATAANLYRLRRARQQRSGRPSRRLVQDCIVPADRATDLVRHLRGVTSGPLWLLPIRATTDDLFGLSPGEWLNVGVYVRLDDPTADPLEVNRALERRVAELGGVKTLHAEIFGTADELAGIYDLPAYEELRRRYHAVGALPHLLTRLGVAEIDGR